MANVVEPERRLYYDILGVSPNCGTADLKRAFYQLALRYHPDKHGSSPMFAEIFKRISHAHEVLKDPTSRGLYDFIGDRDATTARMCQGFFPVLRESGDHSASSSPDLVHAISLTEQELQRGCTRQLAVRRLRECRKCHRAAGHVFGAPLVIHQCLVCRGSGKADGAGGTSAPPYGAAAMHNNGRPHPPPSCPACQGRGVSFPWCAGCRGSNVTTEKQVFPVVIPKSSKPGTEINLGPFGDQFPGHRAPGNVVIRLTQTAKAVDPRDAQMTTHVTSHPGLCIVVTSPPCGATTTTCKNVGAPNATAASVAKGGVVQAAADPTVSEVVVIDLFAIAADRFKVGGADDATAPRVGEVYPTETTTMTPASFHVPIRRRGPPTTKSLATGKKIPRGHDDDALRRFVVASNGSPVVCTVVVRSDGDQRDDIALRMVCLRRRQWAPPGHSQEPQGASGVGTPQPESAAAAEEASADTVYQWALHLTDASGRDVVAPFPLSDDVVIDPLTVMAAATVDGALVVSLVSNLGSKLTAFRCEGLKLDVLCVVDFDFVGHAAPMPPKVAAADVRPTSARPTLFACRNVVSLALTSPSGKVIVACLAFHASSPPSAPAAHVGVAPAAATAGHRGEEDATTRRRLVIPLAEGLLAAGKSSADSLTLRALALPGIVDVALLPQASKAMRPLALYASTKKRAGLSSPVAAASAAAKRHDIRVVMASLYPKVVHIFSVTDLFSALLCRDVGSASTPGPHVDDTEGEYLPSCGGSAQRRQAAAAPSSSSRPPVVAMPPHIAECRRHCDASRLFYSPDPCLVAVWPGRDGDGEDETPGAASAASSSSLSSPSMCSEVIENVVVEKEAMAAIVEATTTPKLSHCLQLFRLRQCIVDTPRASNQCHCVYLNVDVADVVHSITWMGDGEAVPAAIRDAFQLSSPSGKVGPVQTAAANMMLLVGMATCCIAFAVTKQFELRELARWHWVQDEGNYECPEATQAT